MSSRNGYLGCTPKSRNATHIDAFSLRSTFTSPLFLSSHTSRLSFCLVYDYAFRDVSRAHVVVLVVVLGFPSSETCPVKTIETSMAILSPPPPREPSAGHVPPRRNLKQIDEGISPVGRPCPWRLPLEDGRWGWSGDGETMPRPRCNGSGCRSMEGTTRCDDANDPCGMRAET